MNTDLEIKISCDSTTFLRILNGVPRKHRDAAWFRRLQAHLRNDVDKWIDSGVRQGSEDPTCRYSVQVLRDRVATSAIALRMGKFFLRMSLDGSDTIRIDLGCSPEKFPAELEASVLTSIMLAQEWRDRIAKCRLAGCGKYFLLKHHQLRRQTNGFFCTSKHRRHASAAAANRTRRASLRRTLIDTAARYVLDRWKCQKGFRLKHWQDDVQFKRELSDELNKVIGYTHDQVKLNWVSLHALSIKQRCRAIQAPTGVGPI